MFNKTKQIRQLEEDLAKTKSIADTVLSMVKGVIADNLEGKNKFNCQDKVTFEKSVYPYGRIKFTGLIASKSIDFNTKKWVYSVMTCTGDVHDVNEDRLTKVK